MNKNMPLRLTIKKTDMRLITPLIALLLLLGCITATGQRDTKPVKNHPILGEWHFTPSQSNCTEHYDFKPDGTRAYTSAEEIGESAYSISEAPLTSGFYKIRDTIVKNNGMPDCAGSITPPGDSITIFIIFSLEKDQMLMCREESLENCFGPFFRLSHEKSKSAI